MKILFAPKCPRCACMKMKYGSGGRIPFRQCAACGIVVVPADKKS